MITPHISNRAYPDLSGILPNRVARTSVEGVHGIARKPGSTQRIANVAVYQRDATGQGAKASENGIIPIPVGPAQVAPCIKMLQSITNRWLITEKRIMGTRPTSLRSFSGTKKGWTRGGSGLCIAQRYRPPLYNNLSECDIIAPSHFLDMVDSLGICWFHDRTGSGKNKSSQLGIHSITMESVADSSERGSSTPGPLRSCFILTTCLGRSLSNPRGERPRQGWLQIEPRAYPYHR